MLARAWGQFRIPLQAEIMPRGRGKRGRNPALSGQENQPLVQRLVSFGSSYPPVPGLVRVPRAIVPTAVRVPLSFTRRTSMTTAGGSTATQVFTGNGLFDPDVTGVGGQPLGYDQWSAFYSRYRCLASSIEVNATTPDITTNDQGIISLVVVPSTLSSVFTDIDAAASSPYGKLRIVNGLSGGAGPFRPISSLMETDVIMGVPKAAVLSDDTLQSVTTSNPANPWYWHIVGQNTDGAAGVVIQLTVKLTYLVDFFDMSLLSQSITVPRVVRKWSEKNDDSDCDEEKVTSLKKPPDRQILSGITRKR